MAVSIEDTLTDKLEDIVTEYIIQTRKSVDEAKKLDDRLYYEVISKFNPELANQCRNVTEAAVRTSIQEGIRKAPPPPEEKYD